MLPEAALLGANSQFQRDLSRLPVRARSLFLFVTGATPGGTKGHLSTTEFTYLPTYLELPVVDPAVPLS